MTICDIDHLHKRFLDIWEWCMRQGFDTRVFTYVENAFKSEPTAEVADRKDEPQKKEVEWVYNKRERLWYPYLNGELLFKDEPNSSEKPNNSRKE